MKTWYARPVVDKTWINFKDHFEAEHASLRRVIGTTMRNVSLHQANVLASQVLDEVKHVKTFVAEVLLLLSTGDGNKENARPSTENKANFTSQDEGQRVILQILKNCRTKFKT